MESNALLIGINYVGTSHQLSGCINDIKDIGKFLVERVGISEKNIVTMSDDDKDNLRPTGNNIRSQLKLLAEKSKTSSFIFLHYSGHGSSTRDTTGDESDGKDEVLCPIDFPRDLITDDEFFSIFFSKVECPMVVLLDCCHSGTCGDLKYIFTDKNTFRSEGKDSNEKYLQIILSGCRDEQTSADAQFLDPMTNRAKSQGAMTKSFLTTMEKIGKSATILSVITEMRNFLKINNYAQVPQLTCNKIFPLQTEQFIPEFASNNRDGEIVDETDAKFDKLNSIIKGLIYENESLNNNLLDLEIKNKQLTLALNNANRKIINAKTFLC